MSSFLALRALIIAAAAGTLLTGCKDTTNKPEISITMREFSLSVAPGAEDEGGVRIFIDNQGKVEHSLVFARVRDPKELPLAPDGSVDMARALVDDQLLAVGPGRYRIKPVFGPGALVVFCNLVTPGPDGRPTSHFQQGMSAKLDIRRTVSPTLTTEVGS